MTREDLIERITRAMVGEERWKAMPEIASYLERKSVPADTEWRDRHEAREDAKRILDAITNAGFVLAPEEPTEAMITAGHQAVSWDRAEPDGIYAAMIKACPSP